MFGKKTANGYSEEKDLQLLMQAMDGVIGGNYEDIDTGAFQNPAYGEKFNELIHAYKRSNNNFVSGSVPDRIHPGYGKCKP